MAPEMKNSKIHTLIELKIINIHLCFYDRSSSERKKRWPTASLTRTGSLPHIRELGKGSTIHFPSGILIRPARKFDLISFKRIFKLLTSLPNVQLIPRLFASKPLIPSRGSAHSRSHIFPLVGTGHGRWILAISIRDKSGLNPPWQQKNFFETKKKFMLVKSKWKV